MARYRWIVPRSVILSSWQRLMLVGTLLMGLTACAQDAYRSTRDLAPIPSKTLALMREKGMEPAAPILMRSFKKESEIEIWKLGSDGK